MAHEEILVINPGSTSTKVALFVGDELVLEDTLRHDPDEIAQFDGVLAQYDFRRRAIYDFIKANEIDLNRLDAVVGRGGVLDPIPGGTYRVDSAMVKELEAGARGEHASNLGALLAKDVAEVVGISAFIVDPVVVDELGPLARLSGMVGIERRSIFHALNQKAVARRAAEELGSSYEDVNLVVAHLGGGVSIGAHSGGQVIDVNNALDGEGPFSPERSGGVPVGELIRCCFSGKESQTEIYRRILGGGGLAGYLGTTDAREVENRIAQGDTEAGLIYEAMAYQIAKEIGAAATIIKGQVDAIVITGGLAYSQLLVTWIKDRVGFLAPVLLYPGEGEMEALAAGVLRVLRGEEAAKTYVGN